MSGKPVEFTVSGRQVQGSAFEGKSTNKKGEPLVDKNGNAYTSFYLGVAIPKTDPEWPAVEAAIKQTALRDWPDGETNRDDFAWKYIDGDSTKPDKNGKRWCDKGGFPGHHVLGFSANDAKPVYRFENGAFIELSDPKAIKLGDYIQVKGAVKGNDSSQGPGVYLNMYGVLFLGCGEAIVTGHSAEDMFGATPNTSLPPGASATPVAPSSAMPAGNASPPATGGSVVPAPGFLASPPPPPPPPMTEPPVVRYLLQDGNTYTEEQLLHAGYTPDMIAALSKA